MTVIKSQARLSSASTRKLTSEVRQPELKGSNNGNACEFDRRPNGDVDRIWALQAVPYATSPYRGRHTDPPRQPPLLVVLLERPGELVSKEELMAKVWPNTCVVPTNIAVHISALRRALGDGLRGSRYVVNIPGCGYWFIAAITVKKDLPSEAAGGAPVRERNLPDHSASAVGRAETVHEAPATTLAHHCRLGREQHNDRLPSGRQIDRSARQRCVACRLEPKAMPTLANRPCRFDSPFADV
jgi:DNA-binding winged helix-turn-helix (wHTH) protein